MKKLLAILASVGLVSTASMSVVSCVKKDKTPTYKSINDIKPWDLTADNQIIPGNIKDAETKTTDILKKGVYTNEISEEVSGSVKQTRALIFGTIANKFKNPEKFIEASNKLMITVEGDNPVAINDDGTEIYNIHLTEIKMVDGKNTGDESSTIKIRALANAKAFELKDAQELPLDTTSKNNDKLMSTIRRIGTEMSQQSDINTYINTMSDGSTLMELDSWLFEQLADLNKNYEGKIIVPNVDEKGYRFDSLKQQIVMGYAQDISKLDQLKDGISVWHKKLIDFNESLLSGIQGEMKGWDVNNVNAKEILTEAVKNLTLKINGKDKSLFTID